MEAFYGYPSRSYNFNRQSNQNGNYYYNPYYDSNSRPNQLYRDFYNYPNQSPQPTPNPTPKPRVVSIPIHYVNSDTTAPVVLNHTPAPLVSNHAPAPRPLPEMASVKIQKVVRGFLVRKNWSIVRKIEAEAEAIGEEIARDELVLEKDVKARIRFGEMLMSLLFRLDSVRGVRDYRKKVIRKVISLQELVDSIGARGDNAESDTFEVERSDLTVDSVESGEQKSNSLSAEENKTVEPVDSMEDAPIDVTKSDSVSAEENKTVEPVDSMEEAPIDVTKSDSVPAEENKMVESVDSMEESPIDVTESDSVLAEENKMVEPVDPIEESPIDVTDSIDINKCSEQTSSSDVEDYIMVETVNSMEDSPIEPITLIETAQMEKLGEKQNADEEFPEDQELDEVCDPTETIELEEAAERLNPVDEAPGSYQDVTGNNDYENHEMEMKGMRAVMERVVAESERMKNLMEELCQSSARQWQLMEGLVDRVQRLETEVAKMEKKDAKKRKGKKSDSFSKKRDSL